MLSLLTTKFLVIDTETTGLDSAKDRIVEVATVMAKGDHIKLAFHSLVDPGIPIPPESSSIHGIADWDVEGQPTFEGVWSTMQDHIARADCLVAHNAPFDRGFLPETGKRWLDTKRFAQHLWPDAPNHKNQTLRYWKKLRLESIAHSADGDALVTAYLLQLMIQDYLTQGYADDLQSLINYTESPVFISKMPFGKHFGTPLGDVPVDYLQWVLGNVTDNMTADLQWSIEKIVKGEVGNE